MSRQSLSSLIVPSVPIEKLSSAEQLHFISQDPWTKSIAAQSVLCSHCNIWIPIAGDDNTVRALPWIEHCDAIHVRTIARWFDLQISATGSYAPPSTLQTTPTFETVVKGMKVDDLLNPTVASPNEGQAPAIQLPVNFTIGHHVGIPKAVIEEALRIEMVNDPWAESRASNGAVTCTQCKKLLQGRRGLSWWRLHCINRHNRSHDEQTQMVHLARAQAEAAAGLRTSSTAVSMVTVPNNHDVQLNEQTGVAASSAAQPSLRQPRSITSVLQHPHRAGCGGKLTDLHLLELELDPLARTFDQVSVHCAECDKPLKIAATGILAWRKHCRSGLHNRTVQEEESLIRLAHERRENASLLHEEATMSEPCNPDERPMANHASLNDRMTAPAQFLVRVKGRGPIEAGEIELDPLAGTMANDEVYCLVCKKAVRLGHGLGAWRNHCATLIHGRTATEQRRLTTASYALFRRTETSGDPQENSQEDEDSALSETQGSAKQDDIKTAVSTSDAALEAMRAEVELDPLAVYLPDGTVMCKDCKLLIKVDIGRLVGWHRHCAGRFHKRPPHVQDAIIAAAAARVNRQPQAGSQEPLSVIAARKPLPADQDRLVRIILAARREEMALDPVANFKNARVIHCVKCRIDVQLVDGKVFAWRQHCKDIHQRTKEEQDRLLNSGWEAAEKIIDSRSEVTVSGTKRNQEETAILTPPAKRRRLSDTTQASDVQFAEMSIACDACQQPLNANDISHHRLRLCSNLVRLYLSSHIDLTAANRSVVRLQ
ncbi:hypothetical protein BKA62DRAFT_443816 [Auriculariales sp. MPI-PUGE-AT-0066]|nr:hypothetical protein BKA62DRAFT_443816 [Auriculariales sp. MPI-PUGE-AT-0066]